MEHNYTILWVGTKVAFDNPPPPPPPLPNCFLKILEYKLGINFSNFVS